MTEYHRYRMPAATWFFTFNLAERKGNRLLIEHIDGFREIVAKVKKAHPFRIGGLT
jgi:putative transposase